MADGENKRLIEFIKAKFTEVDSRIQTHNDVLCTLKEQIENIKHLLLNDDEFRNEIVKLVSNDINKSIKKSSPAEKTVKEKKKTTSANKPMSYIEYVASQLKTNYDNIYKELNDNERECFNELKKDPEDTFSRNIVSKLINGQLPHINEILINKYKELYKINF